MEAPSAFIVSASSEAPSKARRHAASVLGSLTPERREVIEVILSELVSNAVRHPTLDGASYGIRVQLWLDDGRRIHLSVRDPGTGFELQRPAKGDLREPGGLGLAIVDELADRWGVKGNGGFEVWVELELSEDDEPDSATA